jgi:hypothetical protein
MLPYKLHFCKVMLIKYLAGHMKICNKNHYPKDDIDVIGDDRWILAQAKLA